MITLFLVYLCSKISLGLSCLIIPIGLTSEILLIVYHINLAMLLIGVICLSNTISILVIVIYISQKKKNELPVEVNKDNIIEITIDSIHNLVNRTTQNDCSICLETNIVVEDQTLLKCGHLFHRECINKSFQIKMECPMCRFSKDDVKEMVIY